MTCSESHSRCVCSPAGTGPIPALLSNWGLPRSRPTLPWFPSAGLGSWNCASLPWAGPRLSRPGEGRALPAAQTESEELEGCQPCARLPGRPSGHLSVRSAGCSTSLCPPPQAFPATSVQPVPRVWPAHGSKVQGAGLEPPGRMGADRRATLGHFPRQALCQRLCVRGPEPSGLCLLGRLVSGAYGPVCSLGWGVWGAWGCEELSLGVVSGGAHGSPREWAGRAPRGGLWLNTGLISWGGGRGKELAVRPRGSPVGEGFDSAPEAPEAPEGEAVQGWGAARSGLGGCPGRVGLWGLGDHLMGEGVSRGIRPLAVRSSEDGCLCSWRQLFRTCWREGRERTNVSGGWRGRGRGCPQGS